MCIRDSPKWRIRSDVTSVQTLPLLTDLAEVEMLSGAANLDAAIDTTGNRVSTLRENARGKITFNLAEGQFRNMNLTRMACQGIAMVNQDQLTTTDWGTHTPFNDMRGTLTIKEIAASTTAENGVLKVDEFSGKLYDGGFDANVTLDARSDNPKWRIRSDVTSVQTLPLLTDLAEVEMPVSYTHLTLPTKRIV